MSRESRLRGWEVKIVMGVASLEKEKREKGSSESVSVLVSRRGKNERRAKIRPGRESSSYDDKRAQASGSGKSRCKKRSKRTDFISIGTICDQASLCVLKIVSEYYYYCSP
jgi:hypothetical protein